jgi:hypothetical protein
VTRTTTGVAQRVRPALRDSLWLVPLLCLVGGVGLCIAAAIDQAIGNILTADQQVLGSGPDLTQDGNSRQDGRVRAGVQLRP